jgi:hypothetical protein
MGLAVNVGLLGYWLQQEDNEAAEEFRESMGQVNEVLAEKGLPQHQEPENIGIVKRQGVSIISGFSYSCLYHLRRIYALTINDQDWIPTPTPPGGSPADDDVIEEETDMLESHLLCHSDCAGYYLPIDFIDIIVDIKEENRISGGILCSSYRLMEELVLIAPKLGIELQAGQLSDEEAKKVSAAQNPNSGDDFWNEKTAWLCLFEAARLSIEYKTAICFS